MKKKGFTLVEIIISIGLIVLIGTISIVSFNLVKKNNKIKTLDAMSEEIYTAVNLYIETNNEVKSELYENNNGLKIPLTTLENAGLVDFQNIELDEEDYVVTMLGSTEEDDDHCASTYTAKSWNITSGETIYICEKSNGTQNLVTVAGDADNLSKASREAYYFKGLGNKNFVEYQSKSYRILSIESDDSLVLYSKSSMISAFSGKTKKVYAFESNVSSFEYVCINGVVKLYYDSSGYRSLDEGYVTPRDIVNTSECITYEYYDYEDDLKFRNALISPFTQSETTSYSLVFVQKDLNVSYYKINLKPCMKITSGSGEYTNPYILEDKC